MKQLMFCVVVSLLLAASYAAQDPRGPFANVPTGHWAYQDADAMQKAGVLMINPDKIYGQPTRPMTWHEFAVTIARLLPQLNRPQFPSHTETETRLIASPPAISALQDLVRHFKPELIRLNVDVDTAQLRLADMARRATLPLASQPFPDVPANHWAFSAVETLRLNRIIAGYPQGTFTVTE